MERILLLVEGNMPLRGTDVEKAQSLLKNLKNHLESDLDRASTRQSQRQIDNVERDFYLPAILEAAGRISVDPSSIPDQIWIDEIDIAQKHIKYYLNQLLYL